MDSHPRPMTGVNLDTSGMVYPMEPRVQVAGGMANAVMWPDLSPFEQGYVAAVCRAAEDTLGGFTITGVRFSDLAPETLAAIRKDCAAFGQTWRMQEPERGFAQGELGGRDFWWMRQRGALTDPSFPPLTVTLSDDGKVRFQ